MDILSVSEFAQKDVFQVKRLKLIWGHIFIVICYLLLFDLFSTSTLIMVQVGIVALRYVNANPFCYCVASSYAGYARRQPYAIQHSGEAQERRCSYDEFKAPWDP